MSHAQELNEKLAVAAVKWLDRINMAHYNQQNAIEICLEYGKEMGGILAAHNPFDRTTAEAARLSDCAPQLAKSGEVLGDHHKDWPDWCTTFKERSAYQCGIADARAQTAPLSPENHSRLKQLAESAEHVFTAPDSDGFSRNIDFIEWLKSSIAVLIDGDTPHQDDMAVDRFAAAMKKKLAAAREKGRSGWDTAQCTQVMLSDMLREHVDKGDPLDVANFCMFLWARGEGIGSDIPVADIETCERAVFESLIEKQKGRKPLLSSTVFMQAGMEVPPACEGVYLDAGVQAMWSGWKARANSGMAPKQPEPADTTDTKETKQLVGDMLQTIDSATAFVSRKLRDDAPRLMRKAEAWLKSH